MNIFDENKLDQGIKQTVLWLRSHGFNTIDSGDGKSKMEAIAAGEALNHPHVMMSILSGKIIQETARLMSLLMDAGIEIYSIGNDTCKPCIQALFDPADWSCTISLYGVNDEMLFTQKEKLIRDKSTEEKREFWKYVEETAKTVSKRPNWMHAGVIVNDENFEDYGQKK